MGLWEFLSHQVNVCMAPGPLCTARLEETAKEGSMRQRRPEQDLKQSVSDSLRTDLLTPVARRWECNLQRRLWAAGQWKMSHRRDKLWRKRSALIKYW